MSGMITSIEQLQRMVDEMKPYIWENPLAGVPYVVASKPPVPPTATTATPNSLPASAPLAVALNRPASGASLARCPPKPGTGY